MSNNRITPAKANKPAYELKAAPSVKLRRAVHDLHDLLLDVDRLVHQ
jgi:hypothetical protein